VYAGIDPITKREIRLKATAKTEQQAPRDPRPGWQQVAETLAEAIRSGVLAPDDELASITELTALQGIGTGVIRRALEQLAADGLIVSRRGHTPIVAGIAAPVLPGARKRPGPGHDCRRAGCRPHVCHPMKASTIRGGQGVHEDTKTHQDRWLAIDPGTCTLIMTHLDEIRAELTGLGVELRDDAYLFSNDPAHTRPWNPDWATHKVAEAAAAAEVKLDIKGGRHYTASQLPQALGPPGGRLRFFV
jgi:hypothetical protein